MSPDVEGKKAGSEHMPRVKETKRRENKKKWAKKREKIKDKGEKSKNDDKHGRIEAFIQNNEHKEKRYGRNNVGKM